MMIDQNRLNEMVLLAVDVPLQEMSYYSGPLEGRTINKFELQPQSHRIYRDQ
jgi:hypothetical protein